MRYIFRFDDVCINADLELIQQMTDYIFDTFQDSNVIYGVSPLVHMPMAGDKIKDQRVFPEILNAMSDHREFYRVNMLGVPPMDFRATKAGHGLIHVDHRLLTRGAQELSIIASCSLVGALIFIPPFNKWNKDTEEICKEQNIELIKFEDGWKSMEFNKFDASHRGWYLHSREWTFEKFKQWFQ